MSEANVMTSNFPGYSRIGGERSEPEWREYSLKRISLFCHVTIPHSTPRLRLVVPIVRIMLKSLANDWAKRRSAATVCVYEIGFDCCLHLKIAKYYDGRQLAGGRHPMPPASIKRPPQSSRLNKLKIQILAHQEAFWGSNSFTSSWVPFLEARFLEFIFHVTCFA